MADQRLLLRLTMPNGDFEEVVIAKRLSDEWRFGLRDERMTEPFLEKLCTPCSGASIQMLYEDERKEWIDPIIEQCNANQSSNGS